MPCGNKSIASRNRSLDFSWDLRASAIAASASARLRAISPMSAAPRRLPPESFGLGFEGRPGMRAMAACFIFLTVFGRILGILVPLAFCVLLFCDKCLKKWCLLPAIDLIAGIPPRGIWLAVAGF